MAASRMCHGVTKSGSPTPREITSSICETMSKKRRMPEGAMPSTTLLILLPRMGSLLVTSMDVWEYGSVEAPFGRSPILPHFHTSIRKSRRARQPPVLFLLVQHLAVLFV